VNFKPLSSSTWKSASCSRDVFSIESASWQGRGSWEYEIVSRGHLLVHFFAESGLPNQNETSCYWRVKDADRFHQEFAALKLPSERIPRLTAPVDEPWGMREFTFVDPSGNRVRVGHDLGDAYIPQDSQG